MQNKMKLLSAITLSLLALVCSTYYFVSNDTSTKIAADIPSKITADPSSKYSDVLAKYYHFPPKWISALTEYKKGNGNVDLTVREVSHAQNIEEEFGNSIKDGPQIKEGPQAPKYNDNKADARLGKFEFDLVVLKKGFRAEYDPKEYEVEGKIASFFFEVDTSPEFGSPLAVRYPALTPDYVGGGNPDYQYNEFNLSDVTLNLFHAGHNRLYEDGVFELPFSHNVFLATMPEKRSQISLKELEQISYLLSSNPTDVENHRDIFNFVKLNHVWGGDTRVRKPLESFIAKVVGCGHMNSVAGLLIELSGDRYRMVSGLDPVVKPHLPGGGHSAIEVYSDELGKWSYLDSFLDVYAPGVSIRAFSNKPGISPEKSDYKELADIPVYTTKIEGQDYLVNLGRLFRHRTYANNLGRRLVTPMAYLADQEDSFGLKWKTDTIRHESLDSIKPKARIYVRGRYVLSNCGVRFLDDKKYENCSPTNVEVSPWTTKSYEIERPIEESGKLDETKAGLSE